MESGFLLPDLSEPTAAEFWAGTARGELLVQACGVLCISALQTLQSIRHCLISTARL